MSESFVLAVFSHCTFSSHVSGMLQCVCNDGMQQATKNTTSNYGIVIISDVKCFFFYIQTHFLLDKIALQ